MRKLVPDNIEKIAPYEPGKPTEEVEREFGLSYSVKLASNENPLGPSPLAVAAATNALARSHRYPDGGGFYLRKALSARLNVPMEQIILGAGSTDLIELIAKTFLARDENAVISENAFIMYRLAVLEINGNIKFVPMKNYAHDVMAMADAVDDKTKILFIANPNNPTGTYVNEKTLKQFFGRVPKDVVVVIDEAYRDYIVEKDYPYDILKYIKGRRLIILQTFSKAHGLAGLRIGYGISSTEIIEALNRVRSPFNTSIVAQAAAIAALDDEAHIGRSRENNLAGREFLAKNFDRLGVKFLPTVTNFYLVFCPVSGQEVFKRLLPKGVIVRPMGGWGFPDAVRVSIGTPEHNKTFVKYFEELLRELKK